MKPYTHTPTRWWRVVDAADGGALLAETSDEHEAREFAAEQPNYVLERLWRLAALEWRVTD